MYVFVITSEPYHMRIIMHDVRNKTRTACSFHTCSKTKDIKMFTDGQVMNGLKALVSKL